MEAPPATLTNSLDHSCEWPGSSPKRKRSFFIWRQLDKQLYDSMVSFRSSRCDHSGRDFAQRKQMYRQVLQDRIYSFHAQIKPPRPPLPPPF